MSNSAFVYFIVFTYTLGLTCCSYRSTYGSSYKGVQTDGIFYQQVPVPVYKPVPLTLSKGVGGYGFGGFPGSFGGFVGGYFISSLIFLVIIVSVIRGFMQ